MILRLTIRDLLWLMVLAAVALIGARLTIDGPARDALLPAACVFGLGVAAYLILPRIRSNT